MTAAGLVAFLLVAAPAESSVAERAAAAYKEDRWAEAADLFGEAYQADPNPKYLYAAAQASRLAGDCATAVIRYRTFLEVNELPAAEVDARDGLALCEAEVDDDDDDDVQDANDDDELIDPVGPPEVPTETGPAEPPADLPVDEPIEKPTRRWYADPLGGVLLGTGVAAVIVGGGVYGVAKSDERRANEADREPVYQERIARAGTLSRVAIGLFAVGGAAVLGATIRYAVVGRRSKRRVALGPRGLRF